MLTASVTKKTLFSALLVTLGLVLGYVENVFLPAMPLYGLKIGFSNLVVIYALYETGIKSALMVGVLKAIISGLLFSGIVSIAYGVAGIILSVFSMKLVKSCPWFSETGVSVMGSAAFHVGQIIVACTLLKSFAPVYYLAYLLIGSVFCGIVSGTLIHILRIKLVSLKGFKNE